MVTARKQEKRCKDDVAMFQSLALWETLVIFWMNRNPKAIEFDALNMCRGCIKVTVTAGI